MANTITTWLSGDIIPIGSNNLIMLVVTDPEVANVKFAKTGGTATLLDIPTGLIGTEQGPLGGTYAAANGVKVPAGTNSDGDTVEITVTPYDAGGNPGVPFKHNLKLETYTADSGTKVLTDGNFILTPNDKNAAGEYWRISMEARKPGNPVTPLAGAMVRFIPVITHNVSFWTDTSPPTQILPEVNGYFVKTDASGSAALRIVAMDGTLNAVATVDVAMSGIEEYKRADGYLANGLDSADEEGLWLPPTAGVDANGNIQIPEYGQTFSLDVSVNGETGQGTQKYLRYVVMNNTSVFPYTESSDDVILIDYSMLNQTQNDPNANFFTYVRVADGNVKCTSPWYAGVVGTRVNLPIPNPDDGVRVAPAPVVIPDPGLDRTIGLSTLVEYNALRLSLQDFPTSTLPGFAAGGPAPTVEFNAYMNGYDKDGNDLPPKVYNSNRDVGEYSSVPTVSVVANAIKFSQLYVELTRGAARNWGRNPYTNDKKKVAFEFIITQGSQKWYSKYSPVNGWYYISTGNW